MKENIFEYIKPQENYIFNSLSGIELQELLYYIENYYLEYRELLGFDENVTFGVEIELAHSNNKQIKKNIKKIIPNWSTTSDGTLNSGIELNSPILSDNKLSWVNLKKICSIANKYSLIDYSCGGHIHVGTQTIGNDVKSWLNFIKLWSVYEKIIYRFTYGNYLTARPGIEKYASPVSEEFLEKYMLYKDTNLNAERFIDLIKNSNRRKGVNLINAQVLNNFEEGNTIEFRCPNGSVCPVIWQNNINLFVKMLLYCKNPNFNNDIIDNRQKISEVVDFELYNEIYLDQALEFCDLIFDNNLDKIYFLRQYLKSFETSNNGLQKAKKFIK